MACMNADMGKLIGSAIRQVHDCNIDREGKVWGQTLRVYIELEIQTPLPQGRILNLACNMIWIPLTYEKLPRICFKCGRIYHEEQGCNKKD